MQSTNQAYKLSELGNTIDAVLRQGFPDVVRVEAEIAELRVSHGHCYLSLVEKSAVTDQIVAQQRATIWANTYRVLSSFFMRSTGAELQVGIKVLLQCKITFHPLYGFSLNVVGIEPEFTLGALAMARKKIIEQLEAEGIIYLNKEVKFPLLPQRIAVISSETAAGFGDFMNHLQSNERRFSFSVTLFKALMQGRGTEESVVAALDAIYERLSDFDVVAIIRGGGAVTDLSSFDSYGIAAHVAQFPLPVISGIGHQRDDTIVDLVAHSRVKTPTAAADLLIQAMEEAEDAVLMCLEQIVNTASRRIDNEKNTLSALAMRIDSSVRSKLRLAEVALPQYTDRLRAAVSAKLSHQTMRIDLLERVVKSLDPANMLRRGFAMVECEGRVVRTAGQLLPGNEVTIRLVDGTSTAKIISTHETDKI